MNVARHPSHLRSRIARLGRVAAASGCIGLVLAAQTAPAQAPFASAATALQAAANAKSWHQTLTALRFQAPQDALGLLRDAQQQAQLRGEPHAEWLALAGLAAMAARLDHASSEPLLMLVGQALESAQRAGDKRATFELLLTIESVRVGQSLQPLNEARMAQAAALAAELAEPSLEARVVQLRGQAAAQVGQVGEAMFQYRRALALLTHPLERAGVHLLMAQSLLDSPSALTAKDVAAVSAMLDAAQPTGSHPSFTEALLLRSRMMADTAPAQAVALAQQAAAVAQQASLATPLAQAQMALGHALLSAGQTAQAIASFSGASLDALPPADRLSCLAGWALALARRGDGAAAALLSRGQALAQTELPAGSLPALRFLERSSEVRRELNDHKGALADLAAATALRSAMADVARDKLVQARVAVAQGEAQARTESAWQLALTTAVVLLACAVTVLGGLALQQSRQRSALTGWAAQRRADIARLEQANAARSRHLASACHDLRQPAHVLGLLTEPASTDPDTGLSSTDADSHILAVRRCSHTLIEMLDGLLSLSQLEQGSVTPVPEAVDLGELLGEVDLQYRRAALDKGLGWQVGASNAVVLSDRRLLQRVLFHLASNAVRCTSEGGVQVLVATAAQRVFIEVADTGPGLPADNLLLARDDTAPDAADDASLGVGLGMVRRACKLLGHELSVPITSPRGTVVRIGLTPAPASALATPARPVFDQQSVAVVEPEAGSRQATVSALNGAGLHATGYASMPELVQARLTQGLRHPDLLIASLDGTPPAEAESALRAWRGALLLLTADTQPEWAALAASLGADLACKPLSPGRLQARLAALLPQKALVPARAS